MKRLNFAPVFAAIGTAVLLVGCVANGRAVTGIEVQDAWVRAISGNHSGAMQPETPPAGDHAMPAGLNSAAYMLLRNRGSQADKLLRVESDIAVAVELHKSEMSGEVMTMRPVDGIEIPPGGEVRLAPGGLHVMLIGLKQDLKVGQKVTLTLVFEVAGEIIVEAEAREP